MAFSLEKEKYYDILTIRKGDFMEAITIKDNEEFLRLKSKEVHLESEEYQKDIEVLEQFCLEHEVLAMAAIQVGIPKRIIYLKNTDLENITDTGHNERKILINPVITKREGLTEYWEACASCLTNTGRVLRPYKIELEYVDENRKKQKGVFEGFEATVLSHEYDHLDGILHIDIAEEILQMEKEERKEFRKTHGYQIYSKTGNYQTLLKKKREEK